MLNLRLCRVCPKHTEYMPCMLHTLHTEYNIASRIYGVHHSATCKFPRLSTKLQRLCIYKSHFMCSNPQVIDKTSRTWANTVHTHLLAVQRQLPMREPGEPAPYGVPNNAPPSLRSSRNTDLVTTSESKCPVADPMWLSVSFSCMCYYQNQRQSGP